MSLNTKDYGLLAFQRFLDILRSGKVKSLVEYTANFRAEPMMLMDSECVYIDEMFDVSQSLLSQYAGFYLLAMSAMTTVNNVEVASHLNKLNPNRSKLEAAAAGAGMAGGLLTAMESMNLSGGLMNGHHIHTQSAAMESRDRIAEDGTEEVALTAGAGRDAVKEIRELSDLSVGKLFTCQIQDGRSSIDVPMSVRLMANSLPANSLIHMLCGGKVERGFFERLRLWKAGLLSTADMITCRDIIDARREALMDDKTGIFRNVVSRKRNNTISALLSGQPSVNVYSNLVVLTEASAAQLELAMQGGSLDDFKAREKLFEHMAVMIMAVVDRRWNRVKFYYQSINRPLEVSFRDIKASNKGSGPDVADILNAYRMGTAPTL